MPRRNCKHIYQVIDENPEPLDKERQSQPEEMKK
jgi:hypothetical protein